MEILQKSSLQNHMSPSSVTSKDNPSAAHSTSLPANSHSSNSDDTDDLQLDDITEHALEELQHLQYDHTTRDSTIADILELGGGSAPMLQTISVTNPSPPSLTPELVEADNICHSVVDANTLSRVETAYGLDKGVKVELVDETMQQEESPQIDVAINNVVCTFSTRCHLNLRHVALNGYNVEFKKAQGMLNMKLRSPSATASIWSSGKITVTGANSEVNCKIAARKIARKLQKVGFNVRE